MSLCKSRIEHFPQFLPMFTFQGNHGLCSDDRFKLDIRFHCLGKIVNRQDFIRDSFVYISIQQWVGKPNIMHIGVTTGHRSRLKLEVSLYLLEWVQEYSIGS